MLKEDHSLLHVLKFLFSRRKFIVVFSLVAAILMAVISLIMPNFYKATTTFYAGSPALFNPESIFGSSSSELYFYGSDADVDRLLTIGRSRELADIIIKKYNLPEHYDIDTTNLKGIEKLYQKFNGKLDIKKNKFDAIELSFEDKDRNLVAPISNDCRNIMNDMSRRVIKENQKRMIDICKSNILKNQKTLQIIEDSIAFFNANYRIIDPISQGEQIAELLVSTEANIAESQAKYDYLKISGTFPEDSIAAIRAELEGYRKKHDNVKNEGLPNYSKVAGKLLSLQGVQGQLTKRIGYDTDRLQQLNSAYQADISTVVVIEDAKAPYVKSRPIRSLLVISAGLAGFIFAILYLLFKRNLKYLKELTA